MPEKEPLNSSKQFAKKSALCGRIAEFITGLSIAFALSEAPAQAYLLNNTNRFFREAFPQVTPLFTLIINVITFAVYIYIIICLAQCFKTFVAFRQTGEESDFRSSVKHLLIVLVGLIIFDRGIVPAITGFS